MLAALYPDPDERSRRIGALVSITGLGIVAGPVLGGALVSLAGWRPVFLVNIPVAALALAVSRGLSGSASTWSWRSRRSSSTTACFTLTQWMVDARGLTPLQAGLAFLPMTVPVAFVVDGVRRAGADRGGQPAGDPALGVAPSVRWPRPGPCWSRSRCRWPWWWRSPGAGPKQFDSLNWTAWPE
ncbi:MFS transporter [Actinomadura napierensis]|uniref:MFS transporter n=1 Tax=Actinomadura napierensis TaxID=267854 RepID=UPI00387EAE1F